MNERPICQAGSDLRVSPQANAAPADGEATRPAAEPWRYRDDTPATPYQPGDGAPAPEVGTPTTTGGLGATMSFSPSATPATAAPIGSEARPNRYRGRYYRCGVSLAVGAGVLHGGAAGHAWRLLCRPCEAEERTGAG